MSLLHNLESRVKTHRRKYITEETDKLSQFDAILRGELTRAIRGGRNPATTIVDGFPNTSVKNSGQKVYLDTEIPFVVVNDSGSRSTLIYNIKFDPREMNPAGVQFIDFRPKYFEVRDALVGVNVLAVFKHAMGKMYRKMSRKVKPSLQPLMNAMVLRPPETYGNRDPGGSKYRELAAAAKSNPYWKGGKTRRRGRRHRL